MKYDGEYLFVFSATNKKLGEHIDKILKRSRFKKEEGQRTRIIWAVEDCKKEDNEFRDDWLEELEKKGKFPHKCFVNNSNSAAAKFKIDIFNPENLKPLEKIKKQLVSAILFSDSPKTDCKLTLLIGLLKQHFSPISIAAEYTQPENEKCLLKAGADEVFNRDLLLDYIMALDILNPKSKQKKSIIKTKSIESETRVTDFISGLTHRKDPILGMRSAYLRSIRLSFEEEKEFTLDENKLKELRDEARKKDIRLLAVFCKKDGHKSVLEPLQPNRNITLKNGDCFLLLTHSGDALVDFEKEIIYNENGIFRECIKNPGEK